MLLFSFPFSLLYLQFSYCCLCICLFILMLIHWLRPVACRGILHRIFFISTTSYHSLIKSCKTYPPRPNDTSKFNIRKPLGMSHGYFYYPFATLFQLGKTQVKFFRSNTLDSQLNSSTLNLNILGKDNIVCVLLVNATMYLNSIGEPNAPNLRNCN